MDIWEKGINGELYRKEQYIGREELQYYYWKCILFIRIEDQKKNYMIQFIVY